MTHSVDLGKKGIGLEVLGNGKGEVHMKLFIRFVIAVVAFVAVQTLAMAAVESVDLLHVTVDNESKDSVYTLQLKVESTNQEIAEISYISNVDESYHLTIEADKIDKGIVMKDAKVLGMHWAVVKLKSDEESKEKFDPAHYGDLKLVMMRDKTKDYREFKMRLSNQGENKWAISWIKPGAVADTHGGYKASDLVEFDTIHFGVLREQDPDEAGMTESPKICEREAGGLFSEKKMVKDACGERGIKTMILESNGKTVGSLNTISLEK